MKRVKELLDEGRKEAALNWLVEQEGYSVETALQVLNQLAGKRKGILFRHGEKTFAAAIDVSDDFINRACEGLERAFIQLLNQERKPPSISRVVEVALMTLGDLTEAEYLILGFIIHRFSIQHGRR